MKRTAVSWQEVPGPIAWVATITLLYGLAWLVSLEPISMAVGAMEIAIGIGMIRARLWARRLATLVHGLWVALAIVHLVVLPVGLRRQDLREPVTESMIELLPYYLCSTLCLLVLVSSRVRRAVGGKRAE